MFFSQLVGPTLGRVRNPGCTGVAPLMCDQVVRPLLDQGAGGRSPGFLLLVMALGDSAHSRQKSLYRFGASAV